MTFVISNIGGNYGTKNINDNLELCNQISIMFYKKFENQLDLVLNHPKYLCSCLKKYIKFQ